MTVERRRLKTKQNEKKSQTNKQTMKVDIFPPTCLIYTIIYAYIVVRRQAKSRVFLMIKVATNLKL